MKTILLILSLTICKAMVAQTYFSGEIGAAHSVDKPAFMVDAHFGYRLVTNGWNGYLETNATYFSNNRGQVSLNIGSTVLSERVILFAGLTTYEIIAMGKEQLVSKTKIGFNASGQYQFKLFARDKDRLALDMYVRPFYNLGGYGIGVGLTSAKLR